MCFPERRPAFWILPCMSPTVEVIRETAEAVRKDLAHIFSCFISSPSSMGL